MPVYRLYFMDRMAHIRRCKEIEAGDDDGAVAAANRHAGESPMELWCLARLVRQFEASGARNAAE